VPAQLANAPEPAHSSAFRLELSGTLQKTTGTVNKQELLRKVKELNPDLTMKATATALEAVLDVITEALATGEKVTLVGFGSFEARDRKARQGVNPSTGEKMTIPAARVVGFRVGNELKARVGG
jgi:DNA-binding protein HU-beta